MKKYILYLLLLISNITLLHANKAIEMSVDVLCPSSKTEQFKIQVSSNLLNLSEDAVQDNTGGYVDIPENRFYLKSDNEVYPLSCVVKNDYENKMNQFISFITIQELASLKNSKNLRLIQKIVLEENNKIQNAKRLTTTNIINVYFNPASFYPEYEKCKEEVNDTSEFFYPKYILLILFLLGAIYLYFLASFKTS